MERYASSLRLKEKSSVGCGDITASALHMVLCLMPELRMVPEESKYATHKINDFDEPIPHL